MKRALMLIVGVLLGGLRTFASTPYLGVDPGRAKQADVVKALGEPVSKVSNILQEHKPQDGTGPIYVEYRLGGDTVDRIEVKLKSPVDRAALIEALKLPAKPAGTRIGSAGNLLEYFGDGASMVLAYTAAEPASGVTSISFASDQLFENEMARAAPTNAGGPATGSSSASSSLPSPPPAPLPPPVIALPPSVKRDPSACFDLFLWADGQQAVAERANQIRRRQIAMDVRLKAQAGDCDAARTRADQYKKEFPQ